MDKIIAFLMVISLSYFANAQMPEKFVKAMETRVARLDSTTTADGWIALANDFERIGNAEKNQWLPYYYAAFSNVMAGYMMTNGDPMAANAEKTDPLVDKARAQLAKAEEMEKNNSDIWCVKKMITSLWAMGNVMQRYTELSKAGEELAKAKSLNPDNPRVYVLEAQDKYYTPEQYGGSKEQAKKLFLTAKEKFDVFKPASSIHPNWGRSQVDYFLSLY